MRKLTIIPVLLWLYVVIAWIVNIVKLLNCDFSGPVWKEEIIHAIGLIPGVSMITCWF
jgi:hypothetical protein